RPPIITASEHAGQVEIRVIDHGPGIPTADRERVFLPFQRFGDRDNEAGVGLGLALSRGLAEAMGGTLQPDTTPGGGLTMTLSLPTADRVTADRATATPSDSQAADPAALHRIDHWRERP